MSFVSIQNEDEHNAQDDSPVCRVLSRYFDELKSRDEEIERQRGAAFTSEEMHVASALTGGNDVVQEG